MVKDVRKVLLLMMVMIVMVGCGNMITEDELIGGTWLMTNGYENGEIGGDPVCLSFDEGMEFIDEENVYVIASEKEFIYRLREAEEGMDIMFLNPNGVIYYFTITMEDENAFGLNGSGLDKTLNCYFERKDHK